MKTRYVHTVDSGRLKELVFPQYELKNSLLTRRNLSMSTLLNHCSKCVLMQKEHTLCKHDQVIAYKISVYVHHNI